MNREILPKVKIIINQAMKEAKSFDDTKIRPEHIVLSILSDNDNECTKVLKNMISVSDDYIFMEKDRADCFYFIVQG